MGRGARDRRKLRERSITTVAEVAGLGEPALMRILLANALPEIVRRGITLIGITFSKPVP